MLATVAVANACASSPAPVSPRLLGPVTFSRVALIKRQGGVTKPKESTLPAEAAPRLAPEIISALAAQRGEHVAAPDPSLKRRKAPLTHNLLQRPLMSGCYAEKVTAISAGFVAR